MAKKMKKTLAISLSGLAALGFFVGSLNAADQTPKKVPSVQHELVPHVVLPETIQYNKIAKPGRTSALDHSGDYGSVSPYVATYTPFPSYQVPYTAGFKSVGQSVYPVSPKLLPQPLPEPEAEVIEEPAAHTEITTWEGKDVSLRNDVEPIQLAANNEVAIPVLPPSTDNEIEQTGIFCQQPAKPAGAWSFSSPIFKVAYVPGSWTGNGQTGFINQNGLKGCNQQIGFQAGTGQPGDPGAAGIAPLGIQQGGLPYSTFQMGHPQQPDGPQAQVLPNGMVLLTMPHDHAGCGLLRCKGNQPRTVLLPPAPNHYGIPQPTAPIGGAPGAMMYPGQFGFNGMTAMQQPMMSPYMPQPAMQPQIVPVTAMTPMGVQIVGYQRVPAPTPMMNPMMQNPMLLQQQQLQQMVQLVSQQQQTNVTTADTKASKDSTESTEENGQLKAPLSINAQNAPLPGQPGLIATPFGIYAAQAPAAADGSQPQIDPAQAQAQLLQAQLLAQQSAFANPYAGLYATPYGYVAVNPNQQGLGYGMPMMNAGYQPGMSGAGMGMGMVSPNPQGGLTMSDVIQLMVLMNNNNKQQRRARLFERIAERREERRERSAQSDPLNQLMQAWSTPYVSPDTSLRMPARNAYPYGYFGAQPAPIDTANYGGYYNLYMGNTTYPGLY
jgi:hypothetical protein